MRIYVVAVGQKMPAWAQQATDEYLKRLPKACPVCFKTVAAASRRGQTDINRIKAREADALLAQIPDKAQVILFDERGKDRSTRQLADDMQNWLNEGQDIALVIGGADGFDPRMYQRAQRQWRLSALTLPHPLVRVLVAEQLYRAWSLINNHPYHRD